MRVRIFFSKSGWQAFTSTLDLQKIWERVMRRARLNLQYSQGFHPQPRIQIANPLPVGFIGLNEMVDVWFADDLPIDVILKKVNPQLPEGLSIHGLEPILENAHSLPGQVLFSEYSAGFFENTSSFKALTSKVEQLLAEKSVIRERNHKTYDLRPLIHAMKLAETPEKSIELLMRLSTNSTQTGRPEEVLAVLGYQLGDYFVKRVNLILAERAS